MSRDLKHELNHAFPAAKHAALGDVINDLITAVNLLIIDHNTMATKLNADAGVTDTNYAASAAAAIAVLQSRMTSI